jgi:hypothetical protein
MPASVATPSALSSAFPTNSPAASVSGPSTRPTGHAPAGTPAPSGRSDILSYLSASITLVDLANTDIAVTVTYVDPASGQSAALGSFSLRSFDQISRLIPVGPYRLDFRQPAQSATGPRCTVVVSKGDAYTFAAVSNAIAIQRAGSQPTTGSDLFVATSPLCKG